MILADTTFVIDLLRNRYNVKKIKVGLENVNIALSMISISEIYTGLYYSKSVLGEKLFKKKQEDVQKILLNLDILELNENIVISAGEMRANRLLNGKPIDIVDLIIGATGKFYNVDSIITRNNKHFDC
ncbi:MAG: type II toxin-antitoxin system VapC family toxin, partial [Promethearchaeota archaeon]